MGAGIPVARQANGSYLLPFVIDVNKVNLRDIETTAAVRVAGDQ